MRPYLLYRDLTPKRRTISHPANGQLAERGDLPLDHSPSLISKIPKNESTKAFGRKLLRDTRISPTRLCTTSRSDYARFANRGQVCTSNNSGLSRRCDVCFTFRRSWPVLLAVSRCCNVVFEWFQENISHYSDRTRRLLEITSI